MSINPVDAFRMVAEASVSDRNPTLVPGSYLLQVNKILLHESHREPGQVFFITEFFVLESSSPEVLVQSKRSWVQDMSKGPASQNIKRFVMSLGPNITEKEASDPESLAKLVADDQPAVGCTLRVSVEIRKSARGYDYRYYTWQPAKEARADVPNG